MILKGKLMFSGEEDRSYRARPSVVDGMIGLFGGKIVKTTES